MEDGSVIKYKEKYGEDSGYIYSNYLVKTEEESLKPYDENIQNIIWDFLGSGNATELDYYPYEKPSLKIMLFLQYLKFI